MCHDHAGSNIYFLTLLSMFLSHPVSIFIRYNINYSFISKKYFWAKSVIVFALLHDLFSSVVADSVYCFYIDKQHFQFLQIKKSSHCRLCKSNPIRVDFIKNITNFLLCAPHDNKIINHKYFNPFLYCQS